MAKKPITQETPVPKAIEEHVRKITTDREEAANSLNHLRSFMGIALDEIIDMEAGAASLAALYVVVKEAQDVLAEELKAMSKLVDAIKYGKLPEAFTLAGLTTLTLSLGYRVTVSDQMLAAIPADKRPEAYEWLRANGHEDIITETVNASTLSAFARSEAEEGRFLPDDVFTTHIRSTTSVTKVASRKGT